VLLGISAIGAKSAQRRPAPMSVPPADFPAIFAEHAPFVWRTLRRLGVAEADADDVCQEVFLIVHRKLSAYDGRSTMRAWLYGICARRASDHRRSAYVRRERAVESVPDEGAPADQHEIVERREARAALDAILAGLDDAKREVFVLFELEELSLAEVAAALECPLQTAYSRLQVARAAVQQAFARRAAQERMA
jgi:RNA polymerase sigma-70 factor (ECF subfamily)